jgi:tetratricopeptide (TPR) repeat protein
MRVTEKTLGEIQERLKTMSDFLKIEYLEECLKMHFGFEIKRFCNLKLSELYEARMMFAQAAKNMSAMAEMALTYKEKIESYMRETELWIKAGMYERADESFRKALASGNNIEKEEVKYRIKEFYKKHAQNYEKLSKNANALKVYEKLLQMAITDSEKLEIKKKLLYFYGKLGKIREYTLLKSQLG